MNFMNCNYYCRDCGHQVYFESGEIISFCPTCKKEIKRTDTIRGFTRDARIDQLKAMHELMLSANDEEIYMTWITIGVPDAPSEEDFENIAIDDEAYNECFDLFVKLIANEDCRY